MPQINVKIQYFGHLRDRRGLAEENFPTEAQNLRALWADLLSHHGLAAEMKGVAVAVNNQMKSWDSALVEGDCVAFLPPICGG